MERFYEVMFIVRPDVEDADLDKLIAGFEHTVTNGGERSVPPKSSDAASSPTPFASLMTATTCCSPSTPMATLVAELERRLRVSEPVIKFITVRMDEEQKRIDKIKAIRATKKKVSAQPRLPPARKRCQQPNSHEPQSLNTANAHNQNC